MPVRSLWIAVLPLLAQAKDITFNRDVAPILYRSCANCHHEGDIAPMSLLTYKQTRPWAASIREAVLSRRMPPWHADPQYGSFVNDPRLSDTEIETIRLWVNGGAKEGNSSDLPPAPVFTEGWTLGTPDMIIPIPADYTIAATGPDEYNYFTVPTNFKEDVWVQSVELRPGNRKVVHHAHVFLKNPPPAAAAGEKPADDPQSHYMYKDGKVNHIRPDAPVLNDGCSSPDGGFFPGHKPHENGSILGSYLPGRAPDAFAAGYARRIPAGSTLEFQVHYSRRTGKTETDRTSVGLIFAKGPHREIYRRVDIPNYFFVIPPGDASVPVTACYTFTEDVRFTSYTAHMHYRGKDMKFDLLRPDGSRETLLFVPHYSFNWQTTYKLKEPVDAPKGSRLIINAHFDNSANNTFNPDPSKTIRWGEPSYEEMMDGWIEYVLPRHSDIIAP